MVGVRTIEQQVEIWPMGIKGRSNQLQMSFYFSFPDSEVYKHDLIIRKNTQRGIFVVANDFSKAAINCLNIHNSQQLKGNKGTDFLIIMV